MLKIKIVILFILVIYGKGMAQNAFSLSGKLRLLAPLEIRVESLKGDVILSVPVAKDGVFASGQKEIEPDLYVLWIGSTKQPVYLVNTSVTIKGFYDEKNPGNSSLVFTGIDDFLELSGWLPVEQNSKKKTISSEVRGKLRGTMYSALAYLAGMDAYEPNRMLLELVPENERDALSARWLARRVDSLARFAVGTEAYDFNYGDPVGSVVRLSDFRGKFVLVDFWASWCGPCRQEMKNLLPIYDELKGEDLVFISISLDKREKDWRRMLETENLPWIMLWNKEGFSVGDAPNTIQKAYGFYSIPFIVLIDREGRIMGRGLRGEQVKDAIVKARKM